MEWINIEREKPAYMGMVWVLLYHTKEKIKWVGIGEYNKLDKTWNLFKINNRYTKYITHWMPMVQPPVDTNFSQNESDTNLCQDQCDTNLEK